jgi:hypothetical protein
MSESQASRVFNRLDFNSDSRFIGEIAGSTQDNTSRFGGALSKTLPTT